MTQENQNQTTIREADNFVEVEGIVSELRIEEKEVGGKFAITGEIDIQTEENSVHTFRVFSYREKKDGSVSGLYKGLKTVMDEYKSIASVGVNDADRVRVSSGKLGVNEYIGQDDQLKTFPQFSANFINRIQAGEELNPHATFEVEVVIVAKKEEKDRQGEETGRLILETYIPVYGGKVIPMTFVVADQDAVSYVDSNYEKGETVRLYGDIVNRVEVTTTEVNVGFGKAQPKVNRKTVRELLVTGGSEPYEEESVNAYSIETVKAALAEREIYIEEMKKKKEEGKNKPKNEAKKGFGNAGGKPKKENNKTIEISDDDLPF